MKTEAFKALEQAGVPAKQACGIARAIELECTAGYQALATKPDVENLRAEMKVGFADLRADLRTEMHQLAHETKSEIVRWLFLVMLGQTAVLAAAGYFYINTLLR